MLRLYVGLSIKMKNGISSPSPTVLSSTSGVPTSHTINATSPYYDACSGYCRNTKAAVKSMENTGHTAAHLYEVSTLQFYVAVIAWT
jgi:hypothetical protein